MIGVSRLMDVHRRKKAKAFIAAQPGGETLKEFIYKAGQASMAVVVYFYECHSNFI
jgi:hypothetical protein